MVLPPLEEDEEAAPRPLGGKTDALVKLVSGGEVYRKRDLSLLLTLRSLRKSLMRRKNCPRNLFCRTTMSFRN